MNISISIKGVQELIQALNALTEAFKGAGGAAGGVGGSGGSSTGGGRYYHGGKRGGDTFDPDDGGDDDKKDDPSPQRPNVLAWLKSLFGKDTSIRTWMRIMGAGVRAFQTGSAYAVGAFASISAAAGLLGLAFFALGAAVVALTKAMIFGVREANAYGSRQNAAGVNAQTQGILDAIAVAIGMDKNQFAGIAGKHPGFGEGLLAQLKSLRGNNMSREDLAKALNIMGLPTDLVKLYQKPQDEQDKIFSGQTSSTMTEEQVRTGEEIMYEWNKFKEGIKNTIRDFGLSAAKFFMDAKSMFDTLHGFIPKELTGFFGSTNIMYDMMIKPIVQVFDYVKNALLPKSNSKAKDAFGGAMADAGAKLDSAADKLTRASGALSNAADALAFTNKSGVFGGIDVGRATRAYPTNWAWAWGELHKRNMDDQVYLGAFTI